MFFFNYHSWRKNGNIVYGLSKLFFSVEQKISKQSYLRIFVRVQPLRKIREEHGSILCALSNEDLYLIPVERICCQYICIQCTEEVQLIPIVKFR